MFSSVATDFCSWTIRSISKCDMKLLIGIIIMGKNSPTKFLGDYNNNHGSKKLLINHVSALYHT